jgi:hypothetical protein
MYYEITYTLISSYPGTGSLTRRLLGFVVCGGLFIDIMTISVSLHLQLRNQEIMNLYTNV